MLKFPRAFINKTLKSKILKYENMTFVNYLTLTLYCWEIREIDRNKSQPNKLLLKLEFYLPR